jgi:hypothetical protein
MITRDAGIINTRKDVSLNTRAYDTGETIARAIFDAIASDIARFYIVEDLFTDDLARAIAQCAHTIARPILFISDIRTRAEDAGNPTDYDIVINNMMQHMWAHIMQPTACMLKFRTPFFNAHDAQAFEKITRNPICAQYCAQFSLTPAQIYKPDTREYLFLAADHINLQSFAGSASSETRLIATATSKYAQMQTYNVREYEDTMYYYNQMRDHSFVPDNCRWFGRVACGFDGCIDCNRAMCILSAQSTPNADAARLFGEILATCERSLLHGTDGNRHGYFLHATDHI